MKIKSFFLIGGMLLSLCACQLEPMEVPADEVYLRSFIRNFGLIDPEQTWNMAKSAEVTVIPDGHAARVRVYGKSEKGYRIVADINDVDSKVAIPIDLPKTVNDLKVVIDNQTYYTTVGGTVNAADPSSRSYIYQNGQGYTSTTNADRSTTRTVVTHRGDIVVSDGASRTYFKVSDVSKFFTTLPEQANGVYNNNYPGNLFTPDIKTDFLLQGKGKEIEIFPIYWNTCQSHELGIYYFTSDQQNNSDIVRVPIYKMRKPAQYEDLTFKAIWAPGTAFLEGGNASGTNPGFYQYSNSSTSGAINATAESVTANNNTKNAWKAVANQRVSNYYESQFIITLAADRHFDANKMYCLKFKCTADQKVTKTNTREGAQGITIEAHSGIGNYYGSGIESIEIPSKSEGWAEITRYITFEKSEYASSSAGDYATAIVFNLNDFAGANNYYFTDIELSEATYAWQPINHGKNYRAADVTRFDWRWTFTNPDNLNVVSPSDYPNGNYHITASDQVLPDRNIKDSQETQMVTYAGKYQYVDMRDAHLLMSESANGTLLCPLADVDQPNRTCAYELSDGEMYVASKPIKITVPEGLHYGFYLYFKDIKWPYNEKFIYSEVDGNIEYMDRAGYGQKLNTNDPQDRKYATFCAMFDQPIDKNTTYTYLTFEDWTLNHNTDRKYNGDYDLNDIAFLVMNVNLEEDLDEHLETFEYLICAEDLGTVDDFDFNDMIVGVTVVTKGTGDKQYKEVKFTALAGGGTLPLKLCYKGKVVTNIDGDGSLTIDENFNQALFPDGVNTSDPDNAEWHRWFGVTNVGKMINTQSDYRAGKTCTLNVHKDFTLERFGKVGDANNVGKIGVNGIYIQVIQGGDGHWTTSVEDPDANYIDGPVKGMAPEMFLIQDINTINGANTLWHWPSERVHIYDVYPDFMKWAGSSSNTDWYLNPKAGSDYFTHRPN